MDTPVRVRSASVLVRPEGVGPTRNYGPQIRPAGSGVSGAERAADGLQGVHG